MTAEVVGFGFVNWVWNRLATVSHSSGDLATDARLPKVTIDRRRRRARLLSLTRAVAGERRGKRG